MAGEGEKWRERAHHSSYLLLLLHQHVRGTWHGGGGVECDRIGRMPDAWRAHGVMVMWMADGGG